MFWRRACKCERKHRQLERLEAQMERLKADVEEDVMRVVDLRKRISADIRNLGKRERTLERRSDRIAEREAQLDGIDPDQGEAFPEAIARPAGMGPPVGSDRASRKAAIIQRVRGQ